MTSLRRRACPATTILQFGNNYFTETCSDSEAGSYLRLIDFVDPSALGLRVIKKKKSCHHRGAREQGQVPGERSWGVNANVYLYCDGRAGWREAGKEGKRVGKAGGV